MSNPNLNLSGTNRYILKISGLPEFINNVFELQINGVTLPGVSSGITDISSPIRPISLPGGSLTFDDLYVTFIISEDLREWVYLFNWITSINMHSSMNMERKFGNGELIIMTNKFKPLLSFNFNNLFPYLLGTVDYTNDTGSVETLQSNVSFKFVDMTINTVF